VDEAEEKSWEQIQQYLQQIKPYEFQELVADLLRAMGYHVSWVAPPGKTVVLTLLPTLTH